MSIAPPSDIVLDVAQAADPLKLQAATAKLARMAAGQAAGSVDFGATLDAATPPKSSLPSSFGVGTTLWPKATAVHTPAASTYQKFEAVLLQNFVQNILPKDENLFGDAASADIVRGMMAEQLATQLSKSGRIGIARMIEAAHHAPAGDKASIQSPALVPAITPATLDTTPQTLSVVPATPSFGNTD